MKWFLIFFLILICIYALAKISLLVKPCEDKYPKFWAVIESEFSKDMILRFIIEAYLFVAINALIGLNDV